MKAIGEVLPVPGRRRSAPVPGSAARPGTFYGGRTLGRGLIWIDDADRNESGAKEMTNWAGDRVLVFPLCRIEGEWVYPPVELAPGEERRAAEAAIDARYDAWLKRKKRRSEQGGERPDWR